MKPIVNKTRTGFARWLLGQKAPAYRIARATATCITIEGTPTSSAGDVLSVSDGNNVRPGMVLSIGSDYPPVWRRVWLAVRPSWRSHQRRWLMVQPLVLALVFVAVSGNCWWFLATLLSVLAAGLFVYTDRRWRR